MLIQDASVRPDLASEKGVGRMAGFKVAANLGSLQGDTLLTKEQVHGKAAEPLAPTIPEEKAKQMSGDTPLLRGLAET